MSEEIEDLETESEDIGISEDLEDQYEADEDGTSDELEASSDDAEDSEEQVQELIPGRFKDTPEDVRKLADAYRNLEAYNNRILNEYQQSQRNSTPSPEDKAKRLQQFRNEIQEDPLGAIENLAKESVAGELSEIEALKFQTAYERYKTSHDDFTKLEPTMMQLADQWRDMIRANNLQNDPRLLDVLYTSAKGVEAERLLKDATSTGKKAGTKAARKKQKASIEGASGSKGQKYTNFETLSLKEMEKRLGIKKH